MALGYLTVFVTTSNGALPVKGAKVYLQTSGFLPHPQIEGAYNRSGEVDASYNDYEYETDESGKTKVFSIEAPDKAIANNEYSEQIPYSVCDCYVEARGFVPVRIRSIQIFGENESVLPVTLYTYPETNSNSQQVRVFDIVPHTVASTTPRNREHGEEISVEGFVQEQVIIPQPMIVHIGVPGDNGKNIYLSFPEYVKNCASSEIYPTWNENALRANIYAIISLSLNRVYTEWYPTQGYNFYITNSTQYDQSFVEGRNIFTNISRIVDEIFNTYILKSGSVNPYFAEYCDGKRVSCNGLSQWGTTYLADQGYTPLQILKYYYGDDIRLATTNNISEISSSYPGSPLSLGSTGEDVRDIQRQLNRISKNYPSIQEIPNVNGIFGAYTDSAVRQFQNIFNLTSDGIVGKSTWYAISYIYVAVTRLAQLTAEGETAQIPENPPTVSLTNGSEGEYVGILQYILNYINLFYSTIPSVEIDGNYGNSTQNAVVQFQKTFGLQQTGNVDAELWNKLYDVYNSILQTVVPRYPEQIFPGNVITIGSSGEQVRLIQSYLNTIATRYPEIPTVTADGQFGNGTRNAVIAFQTRFNLTPDGVIGLNTWSRIIEIYNFIENGTAADAFALVSNNQNNETDENFPLRFGSSGPKICKLQAMLNAINKDFGDNLLKINCYFGDSTRVAVTQFQRRNNLKMTGNVDYETWNILNKKYEELN